MSARQLPPDDELLDLSRTMSNAQLANAYGVTVSAVAKLLVHARRRTGRDPERLSRPGPRLKTGPAPSRRLPADDELLALVRQTTHRELGEEYGVTARAVSMAVRRARQRLGLPKPPRKPKTRKPKPKDKQRRPPKAELDDALRRWAIAGTAEEYDVTEAQVVSWMRELGI